jgi:hypothetical protein
MEQRFFLARNRPVDVYLREHDHNVCPAALYTGHKRVNRIVWIGFGVVVYSIAIVFAYRRYLGRQVEKATDYVLA